MKTVLFIALLLAGMLLLAGCAGNASAPAPSAPPAAPAPGSNVGSPSAPSAPPASGSGVASTSTPTLPMPSAPASPTPSAPSSASPPAAPTPIPPAPPIPSSVSPAPSPASGRSPSVVEVWLTATPTEFVPNVIRVKKGDRVRVTITSTETEHGFGISEYGISEVIPAGGQKVIEFTADKAGTFPFMCTVFCGSGHATMRGTLTVAES